MLKKWISLLSIAALLGTELAPMVSYAAPAPAVDEQELKETLAASIEEYPDGLFGFYETQLEGTEGEKREILVVRQGGTENAASVVFKAIDVSASYGQDYLLTVKESAFTERTLEAEPDAKTLVEQYSDSLTTEDDGSLDVETEETGIDLDMNEEDVMKALSSKKNGLAAAKAAQTGVTPVQSGWRTLEADGEKAAQADEILESGEAEVMAMAKDLDGVSCTLEFAPGEYKKVISVDIIDDVLSESQEQVMFALYDAEGSGLGSHYNAYLNIVDNDEMEAVGFAMRDSEIMVSRADGEAVLTVERRTGLDQMSVVTVGTSQGDALPGTDYEAFTQELVFAPGMTEKEVRVKLLNGQKEEKVSFYVGLTAEGATVDESANSTLVTIVPDDSAVQEVQEGMEGLAKTDTYWPKKEFSVSKTQNGTTAREVAKGIDLSTASEVRITWKSDKGEYEYGGKCDKKTARNRKIMFYIGTNGSWNQNTKVYEQSKDGHYGSTTAYITLPNGAMTENARIFGVVSTYGENRNANLYVEKIEVIYPGYTFTINNDFGHNQQGKLINTTNTYVEQIYSSTGKGGVKDGNVLQLGQAKVNGSGSATVYKKSDSFNLTQYLNKDMKTSSGIAVDSSRVSFEGWQIRLKGKQQWGDTIDSITFDKSFIDTCKKKNYLQANNVINIRPVYQVKDGSVTFKNAETNKGTYKGYNNNSVLKVKTLDTVNVVGVPKTGFAVTGFSLTEKIETTENTGTWCNPQYVTETSERAVDPIKSDRADTIKITPLGNYTVSMLYTEPTITVKADPKGNNTGKGSVMYADASTGNAASGNNKKEMVIKPVSLEQIYRLIGIPDAGYMTYWRDGTLDTDKNGAISEKEIAAYPEYKSFTPISGDVLAYTTKLPFTRIYYDFYPASKVKNPQDIEGKLILKEKEIYTGKESKRGINGATITVSNQSELTKNNPSSSRQKGGDGYFSVYDDTFSVYGYYLANISYTAPNGGSINTSEVCTPGMFKTIEIDANEKIWVENAEAYLADGGKEKLITSLTDINNGKHTYRLKIQTGSIPSVIPKKATLRFYDRDGKLSSSTVTKTIQPKDNGWFTLEFKPFELGLTPGTRLTVQFEDSNGFTYLERETGITLTEAIGTLDLLNSFAFGGANTAIKLVGTIDSAFNLGWNGDFDESDAVSTVTDENGNTVKTISLGFSKDGISKSKETASLQSVAQEKADLDEQLLNLKNKAEKETDPAKRQQINQEIAKTSESKAAADKKYNEQLDKIEAGDSKTKTNIGAGVNLDVGFKFSMSFALDKTTSQWYFKNMMVLAEIKGGAEVNVEFVTPIGITIYLGFGAGGSASALFVVEERKDQSNPQRYYLNTLAEDKNGEKKINIFDCDLKSDDRAFDGSGTFEVNPYISIKAGAGIGKLITVTVTGTAQFYMTFYTDSRQNTGMVNLSASIGVSVMGIGGDWPFVSKDVNLFGNSGSAFEELENLNYLHDSSDMLQANDRAYLENRGGWNDGSGMSAYSVEEDGAGVSITTLQEGVYTHPDAKLISFGDGKMLAVFLDDDMTRESINAAAAYYAIFDGQKWQQPVLLEDDGTLDEAPVIEDLGDKGILVAWSSADQIFTNDTSRVAMMNSLNIHARLFNKTTMAFGDVMEVTKKTGEDTVSDVNPSISYSGNDLIVYYTKNEYEVSSLTEGEVIGDVIHPAYSLMAYRKYDFASGTWKDTYTDAEKAEIIANIAPEDATDEQKTVLMDNYEADWYGQIFMNTAPSVYIQETLDEEGRWTEAPQIFNGYTVQSPDIKDSSIVEGDTSVSGSNEVKDALVIREPKIVDSTAISYNGLGLFAYVVDYDESLTTVDDRDIYMQIYDFENDVFSHPIMLTSDNVSDMDVQFIRLNSSENASDTYLCWLSGGDIKMMNISRLVRNSTTTLLKGNKDGIEYYYVNKAADCEEYEPAFTVVEGPRAEDTDNAESEITGFDSYVVDNHYIYFVWTQNGFTLKEGVEPDSEEAADVANRKVETQIYASRYDMSSAVKTDALQITSGNGLNYGDLAFVADEQGSLKMIATVTGTEIKDYEEFKKEVEDYNSRAAKEDQMEIPTEEEYTAYAQPDEKAKALVAVDVNCTEAYPALENVVLEDLTAGADNTIDFMIKNEGFGTAENLTVTVKDEDGRSILMETVTETTEDSTVTETRPVDAITIDRLYGGQEWDGQAILTLDEEAVAGGYTIRVENADGVVAEKSFHEEIEQNLALTDFEVTETGIRNVFELKAKVENLANRISAEDTVSFTMTDKDGNPKEIASAKVEALDMGASTEITAVAEIDEREMFVTERTTDEEGNLVDLISTGTFNASVNGSEKSDIIERFVSADAYKYVESIQEMMINDGKPIETKVGDITKVTANIRSSMADEQEGITGTEGLHVIWGCDDPEILDVYDAGGFKALKEGKTKLNAYVMPKCAVSQISLDMTNDSTKYFEVVDNRQIPVEAIKICSTEVTVKTAGGTTPEPPKDNNPAPAPDQTRVGDTAAYNGGNYKVTSISAASKEVTFTSGAKTAKTVSVPATIKIGSDVYKVTGIASGAFKGNKALQTVTIGSNVKTIGTGAFSGCTKLKKVTFKGTALKKIEASAFAGCKKLTAITIPKNVTSIGKKAFYGCTSLKKVVFKTAKKTAIGKSAFAKTNRKAVFSVPKKYLTVYKKALKKAGIASTAVVKKR